MHKNKRGGRTKYAHAINQTITTAPTAEVIKHFSPYLKPNQSYLHLFNIIKMSPF